MVNVNVNISDELFNLLKKRKTDFSGSVERTLWEETLWDSIMETLAVKSKLTEKDVEEIGEKIKISIAKRHGL